MLTFLKRALLFSLLTAITQTGGVIYLLYLAVTRNQREVEWKGLIGGLKKVGAYLLLYLIFNLTLTPFLAKFVFNRVPMPIYHETRIKPANAFIWLANRHYVSPALQNLLYESAQALPKDQAMVYLDANFPWIDGFPLVGHLSHDDGQKIDLAFVYTNPEGEYLNTGKSLSGYGIAESPHSDEVNQPALCDDQGHWQYSLTTRWAFDRFPEYTFDRQANRRLLQALALNNKTGKIFIEPHLKTRLELQWFQKIRFHGCHAVRHDDHIHLQL